MNLEPLLSWNKIPNHQFDLAVHAGLLIAAAVSVLYIFFGRLYSMNELIGSILKSPKSQYSRNSIIIISGVLFISAIIKTFYHEHHFKFYPYDEYGYLQKISTFRLIIAGIMVGFGSQYARGLQKNDGLFGVPRFTLRSIFSFIIVYATCIFTVTNSLYEYIPDTPRILDINLPKNIVFSTYLLASILIPFICFLISPKKSLKGLVEAILLFLIGITVGFGYMLINLSKIKAATVLLNYTSKWTPNILLVFAVATAVFFVVYLIMKYAIKKPLFTNALLDQKGKISIRLLIGCVLVGVGWGLTTVSLETFLINIPIQSLRITVFWGIPCIFSMKAAQLLTVKEEIPIQEKME